MATKNIEMRTFKVILSIILFVFVYLFIIVAAFSLFSYLGYLAIEVVSSYQSFWSVPLALVLLLPGIISFLFLIRFLFAKKILSNDVMSIELKRKDEPELFKLIEEVAYTIKSETPKKIFITSDVNAFISYDSSFWSMFFPVKKNLYLGLGLLNSLNESELKAVVAHELGHFSQKSWFLSRYIYTVNRALYYITYDDSNHSRKPVELKKTSTWRYIVSQSTHFLRQNINSLLQSCYNLINIQYRSMSRELEFEADRVAARATGTSTMLSSLKKSELGSYAFELNHEFLLKLAEKHQKVDNMYESHSFMIDFLYEKNGLSVEKKDILSDNNFCQGGNSRINITDLWASHPSLQEREYQLSQIEPVPGSHIIRPSLDILFHARTYQATFTARIYDGYYPGPGLKSISMDDFKRSVLEQQAKHQISPRYNGFYEDRFLSELNPNRLLREGIMNGVSFQDIYSIENKRIFEKLDINRSDLELLRQIKYNELNIKYFEFDHRKYRQQHAGELIRKLNNEVKELESHTHHWDKLAFYFNYIQAKKKNTENEYVRLYHLLQKSQARLKKLLYFYHEIQQLQYHINHSKEVTSYDPYSFLVSTIKLEKDFKHFLNNSLASPVQKMLLLKNNYAIDMVDYTEQDELFIMKSQENVESEFLDLYQLIFEAWSIAEELHKLTLKRFTDFQLTFQETEEISATK